MPRKVGLAWSGAEEYIRRLNRENAGFRKSLLLFAEFPKSFACGECSVRTDICDGASFSPGANGLKRKCKLHTQTIVRELPKGGIGETHEIIALSRSCGTFRYLGSRGW